MSRPIFIFSVFCILLAAAAIVAFRARLRAPRGAPQHAAAARPVRLACVGDSLTAGLGMDDPAVESYPAQLGRMLGGRWEVRGFAASGHTASRDFERSFWNHGEFKAALEWGPDVAVICLGTNDSWPSRWVALREKFAGDLKDMAKTFMDLPSKPRCFLCIPTPLFIEDEIQKKIMVEEVNAAIREVARGLGLEVVDFYGALLEHPEFFRDKVHPTPAGAGAMAAAVLEKLNPEKFRHIP